VPKQFVYRILRWFHGPATAMMVATPSLKQELEANGFRNVRIWARGVDVAQFRRSLAPLSLSPIPIWLYVGRIAVEKKHRDVSQARSSRHEVIIGDGPARSSLARAYPDARFLGPKSGEELVRHYAASDVFVFRA